MGIKKNKKADIANFLRKTSLNKEIPFPRKGNLKSKYLLLKNKKADIAITILVIAVVVLCATALFSFYVWNGKIGRTVDSVYFLQDAYNLAESINYSVKNSGIGMIDKYDGQNRYSVKPEGQEVVIKRTYYKKDLGIAGIGVDINEEVLKITYSFIP